MPAPNQETIDNVRKFHHYDEVTGKTIPKLGALHEAKFIEIQEALSIASEVGQDLVTIHNAKFAIVALVRMYSELKHEVNKQAQSTGCSSEGNKE